MSRQGKDGKKLTKNQLAIAKKRFRTNIDYYIPNNLPNDALEIVKNISMGKEEFFGLPEKQEVEMATERASRPKVNDRKSLFSSDFIYEICHILFFLQTQKYLPFFNSGPTGEYLWNLLIYLDPKDQLGIFKNSDAGDFKKIAERRIIKYAEDPSEGYNIPDVRLGPKFSMGIDLSKQKNDNYNFFLSRIHKSVLEGKSKQAKSIISCIISIISNIEMFHLSIINADFMSSKYFTKLKYIAREFHTITSKHGCPPRNSNIRYYHRSRIALTPEQINLLNKERLNSFNSRNVNLTQQEKEELAKIKEIVFTNEEVKLEDYVDSIQGKMTDLQQMIISKATHGVGTEYDLVLSDDLDILSAMSPIIYECLIKLKYGLSVDFEKSYDLEKKNKEIRPYFNEGSGELELIKNIGSIPAKMRYSCKHELKKDKILELFDCNAGQLSSNLERLYQSLLISYGKDRTDRILAKKLDIKLIDVYPKNIHAADYISFYFIQRCDSVSIKMHEGSSQHQTGLIMNNNIDRQPQIFSSKIEEKRNHHYMFTNPRAEFRAGIISNKNILQNHDIKSFGNKIVDERIQDNIPKAAEAYKKISENPKATKDKSEASTGDSKKQYLNILDGHICGPDDEKEPEQKFLGKRDLPNIVHNPTDKPQVQVEQVKNTSTESISIGNVKENPNKIDVAVAKPEQNTNPQLLHTDFILRKDIEPRIRDSFLHDQSLRREAELKAFNAQYIDGLQLKTDKLKEISELGFAAREKEILDSGEGPEKVEEARKECLKVYNAISLQLEVEQKAIYEQELLMFLQQQNMVSVQEQNDFFPPNMTNDYQSSHVQHQQQFEQQNMAPQEIRNPFENDQMNQTYEEEPEPGAEDDEEYL